MSIKRQDVHFTEFSNPYTVYFDVLLHDRGQDVIFFRQNNYKEDDHDSKLLQLILRQVFANDNVSQVRVANYAIEIAYDNRADCLFIYQAVNYAIEQAKCSL